MKKAFKCRQTPKGKDLVKYQNQSICILPESHNAFQPEMEVNLKNRKAEPGLRLINMENVAVEQVEWLLYPFIPIWESHNHTGRSGEGKTTMVLQIIAKLTKGEPVLPVKDGEEEPTEKADEPVNVIYQTAEDGLGDTIKPRLVVLDPIQSFLGAEVDMHRANEIRPLMKRVSVLAENITVRLS